MRANLRNVAILTFLLSLAAAPALAGWQDEATPRDVQRLMHIDQSREAGIAALDSGPVKGDAAAMRDIAGAEGQSIQANELVGDWQCRTMKLGGVFSILYSWFDCRVSERDGHLYFEKLNGSLLINGWLYPQSGRYVLLGSWSVTGEPRHAYSGNAPGFGASGTPDDAIGLVSGLGPDHVKIEFPAPLQESVFDVMELRR